MIAIASDHGGYALKEEIKKYFDEKEIKYKDFGIFCRQIWKQNFCKIRLSTSWFTYNDHIAIYM